MKYCLPLEPYPYFIGIKRLEAYSQIIHTCSVDFSYQETW